MLLKKCLAGRYHKYSTSKAETADLLHEKKQKQTAL